MHHIQPINHADTCLPRLLEVAGVERDPRVDLAAEAHLLYHVSCVGLCVLVPCVHLLLPDPNQKRHTPNTRKHTRTGARR